MIGFKTDWLYTNSLIFAVSEMITINMKQQDFFKESNILFTFGLALAPYKTIPLYTKPVTLLPAAPPTLDIRL